MIFKLRQKEEKLLEDRMKRRGKENCMYGEEEGRGCVRKAVRKRRK